MLSALLERAHSSLAWRGRILYYSCIREKESLGFAVMIALPLLTLCGMVYFGYTHGIRVDLIQQREAALEKRAAEIQCLAENIYFEARGEPLAGQYAVAEVTLNRVASPYFPKTVCGVVHQTHWDSRRRRSIGAFSWTELEELGGPHGPAWRQAMKVATTAYDGLNTPLVPGALYYHATSIKPYWASSRKTVARIGEHVFYR
jgi:spore germination cell wall hydrolase CwlJ-like protein